MPMQEQSVPVDTATLLAIVRFLREENEHLKLLVAKLQRMQFGRRSETLDAEEPQRSLSLDGQSTPPARPLPQRSAEKPACGKPSRNPLPAHLPREAHQHCVDTDHYPGCGGALRAIGEDVSEVLGYVPARFKVIRHVRPKQACTVCHTLVQAGAPERPIARGLAGSPDRKGQHSRRHLASYQGAVHADGFAGFNPLFEHGKRLEVACWAQVRRKFYEIHQARACPLATMWLDYIQHLYHVECPIRGKTPDERQRWWCSGAGPILDELHQWLHLILTQISRKSALAEAIRYALSRWTALPRYRDDGRLEIDNNAAERALRAIALGRNNYLFVDSDTGGERAAAFYSLIGTAKLNGLDPETYLCHVIERIAAQPVNRVDELLPWGIAWPKSVTEAEAA